MRSRAVTMGQIADILFRRGDLDAARAAREESLDTLRRLGDADGIAAALWGVAQLDLAEEKFADAAPRIVEAYDIVTRLGRAEGIAVIGMVHGQFLAAADQPAEAVAVLQRSAEMFRKLGRESEAHQAEQLIAELGL